MENRKQPPDFHLLGCYIKIDQLIWNITVITKLETGWPQEATISVVINILKILLLSESHCKFVFGFAKMYFRFYFSDLEYYIHFAMLNICLRRKLELPQSPLI